MGLAISHQLVRMMGSKIKLDSIEGKGSKFCFNIDFEIGKTIKSRSEISPNNVKEKAHNSVKVLLAEDNPVNQKVMSLMLEQIGAEVVIANNGLEAVEHFSDQAFDIVLMDLQMPEMDGLEATREIKASAEFQTRNTPIIAVTANAFVEDRSRAMEAGMDDFLTKPIRPEEFKGMLAKFIPDLVLD